MFGQSWGVHGSGDVCASQAFGGLVLVEEAHFCDRGVFFPLFLWSGIIK